MIEREKISAAAKTLDDLLSYTPSQGDCPVSREEAEQMWKANELHGFAAVRAFLDVCKSIHTEGETSK